MLRPGTRTSRWLHQFSLSQDGSVALTSALALPVLIGMAGLAIEFGDALVTRAETQRVADLAVHAGIVAFERSGNAEAVTRAAHGVATLNGVPAAATQVALDLENASGPIVRVAITTPRPLVLAQAFAPSQSLDVHVRAAARLDRAEPACVLALDRAGTGITIGGGTSITTPGCAVSSNSRVEASGSARITTQTLFYDSDIAPSFSGGASLVGPGGATPQIIRASSADPLAQNEGVALAQARLAVAAALQAPVLPAVPTGPNILFGWNQAATIQQAQALGCTASFANSTWTFGCPSGATIVLGNLTIGGGLNLDFGLSGSADTTYRFSGSIQNAGDRMRFGPGSYHIAQGLVTGGGTTTTFGAGTFRIGRPTTSCSGATGYSICNNATLSFEGPSVFELAGGIYNAGGASIVMGTGEGNSFHIGPASNGNAFTLPGGSSTLLGDATGAGDRFRVKGNVLLGGGGCLRIGAATNHDISGRLDLSGGVTLGSGLYAIDGYLHLGANNGGSVWCEGRDVSLRALNVTLVLSGRGATASNQNCHGVAAFCAGAGYNSMQLVAPSTGPFARLAVLGPLTADVTAGAAFGGGASGSQISGAFYFPNGPINLTGGASVSGQTAGCLQLIGTSVTMSGGTTVASECALSETAGFSIARLIE